MHTGDDDTVNITRRLSSMPKYTTLNPMSPQIFAEKDVVMVAGIVQPDLKIVEISIEKITCGNSYLTIFRSEDVSKISHGGMQIGRRFRVSLQT